MTDLGTRREHRGCRERRAPPPPQGPAAVRATFLTTVQIGLRATPAPEAAP